MEKQNIQLSRKYTLIKLKHKYLIACFTRYIIFTLILNPKNYRIKQFVKAS